MGDEPPTGDPAPGSTLAKVSGCLDQWPPDLLEQEHPPSEWLVVRSYPRREKQVAQLLRERAIPRCIFYERRLRVYRGKGSHETLVPLLGGYLFAAFPAHRRYELLGLNQIFQVLEIPDQSTFAGELGDLKKLIEHADDSLTVRPEIVPGSRVVVAGGAMAGCAGVVLSRKGHSELVVNLRVLGHSVAARISAATARLARDGYDESMAAPDRRREIGKPRGRHRR